MKKLIYSFAIALSLCMMSTLTTSASAKQAVTQEVHKSQTYVAGYFTYNGIVYEVWVEDDAEGFGMVVAIVDYTNLVEVEGSGVVEPGGRAHVTIYLDSSTYHYAGKLRVNP